MWNHEADVVIVGCGGAGVAAAITANNAGASVIVLEKNPEGGGNTKYSGGSLRTYLDVEKATDYIESLCEGTTERDVIRTFVRESGRNSEWIRQIGGEVVERPTPPRFPHSLKVAFPSVPGAEGIGPRVRVKGAAEFGGIDLWGLLANRLAQTKVKVLYSTPAKQLCVDKHVGVSGVVADDQGNEIRVRARRGVILTCGGFEYDHKMQMNYIGHKNVGLCNPANTGDGIRMAAEIGADLWHMSGTATTFGYKFPEFPCGIRHSMASEGYIYADQFGERFMDEPGTDAHFMWMPSSFLDTKTLIRPRVPAYVIFDEDTRTRGTIAVTGRGKISDLYQWSRDNSAEIKKGWIKAAASIGDLAVQLGMRADVLQTTVSRYNVQCVGGYDADFGRVADTLTPIARPPYYAAEIWPSLFNTQGGPKRNAQAQVLDVRGNPIKRLYSAGELGSLWHRNYPGAGNVSEALAYGRIAGKNAAAELPVSG